MRRLLLFSTASLLLLIPVACGQQLQNGAFTAELNGFEIFYEVRGGGPVCLVAPVAWGMAHEGLANLLAGLEEHLTLVYFDPRGVGRSQEIGEAGDRSMEAVAEDLDALRRRLGLESVIVLGWSNGGQVAMKYASAHPEAVERLILLHTVAHSSADADAEIAEGYPELVTAYVDFFRDMLRPGRSEEEQDELFGRFMRETYFPWLFNDFEASRERFHEAFAAVGFSWDHMLYQQQVDGPVFDARGDLAGIAAPTLVVAGRSDLLPPGMVEDVHRALASSTFVVFEESGHFSPIEEPEAFVRAVVEFLER